MKHIENQTGIYSKPIGMKRIRAIELIKQEMTVLSKYVDITNTQYINKILKRHLINTMLHVIQDYPLCSLAGSQALHVLGAFKNSFDLEDLRVLKAFVMRNLNNNTSFVYESGNQTAANNQALLV